MAKRRKKMRDLVGLCCYCERSVFRDQGFEVLEFTRDYVWSDNYKQGPIHSRCVKPVLKRFCNELKRDILTLNWVVESIVTTAKNGKTKKGEKGWSSKKKSRR